MVWLTLPQGSGRVWYLPGGGALAVPLRLLTPGVPVAPLLSAGPLHAVRVTSAVAQSSAVRPPRAAGAGGLPVLAVRVGAGAGGLPVPAGRVGAGAASGAGPGVVLAAGPGVPVGSPLAIT